MVGTSAELAPYSLLADGEDMNSSYSKRKSRSRSEHQGAYRLFAVGCVAGLALMAVAGMIRIEAQETHAQETQAQDSFPLPSVNPPGAKATQPATAPTPGSDQQSAAAPNASETKIARQCADLLKMAAELKTEVDKTTQDTLSVAVVRKAGEIEQLAHKVRTTSGKN